LLLQLRHQGEKARVVSEVVQIRLLRKHRVTRKAVVGCRLQPLEGWRRLLQDCIRAGNVIRRVMKVTEALAFFNRAPDL
jgi:hypothetical protein